MKDTSPGHQSKSLVHPSQVQASSRLTRRWLSRSLSAAGLAAMLFGTAALQAPAQEFRAAWADIWHVGMGSQAQVDTMVAALVSGRYNVVIVQVVGYMDKTASAAHGAFYRSSILPRSSYVTDSFDPLAYLCTQAHANGIQVHAWIGGSGGGPYRVSTVWPPANNSVLSTHPEWFMAPYANSEGGSPVLVDGNFNLDMGSPDAQEYVISIVKELVTNYEIDGINWDDEINSTGYNAGVGYPAWSQASYARSGLARFRINTGYVGTPANTVTAWSDYRRRFKNELMARAQAEIQSIKTNPRQPLRHTIAPLAYSPVPTSCDFTTSVPYRYFCDWAGMLQKGIVDAAIPQTYSSSTFNSWADLCSSCWQYNRQIFSGIGAYLQANATIASEISYLRSQGLKGYSTYSYAVANSSATPSDWWPYAAANVNTSTATVPTMPWRDPATATEGIVWGSVTNVSTGDPVDDASVTVSGVATTFYTDGNGYYIATLVPAPSGGVARTITVSKSGMTSQSITAIAVAGDITRWDLKLNPVAGFAPALVIQPVSQTVNQGNNVNFRIAAGGSTPLSYQWRLYGTNISGATGSIYTRTSVQPADAGPYSVVVNNSAGSATSSNAVLTVQTTVTPPGISTQPASQTVIAGQDATFTVTATGSEPLSYQWRFNTIAIGGATTSSYTRNNVQTTDAGSYSVVITNTGGSVTSADAVLTVEPAATPPGIAAQPASQTIIAGQSATFTVTATGTAPLSYQWRFNTVPIGGATTSSYTRSNVQTTDAGSYSVVITNTAGTTNSADAVLTVNFSLTATASGGGTVSKSPDLASYSPNAVVTLTATTNTGYAFDGWAGDASGTYNPLSVTMTANKTITANFVSTATELVIDNTDPGWSNTSPSGSWTTGSSGSVPKIGVNYLYTAGSGSSSITRSCRWTPEIGTAGLYDVYVYYQIGQNRNSAATYRVVYNGGTVSSLQNQYSSTPNQGGWFQVGTNLPFATGTSGYVWLGNDSPDTANVSADAARFVLITPLTSPSITGQPVDQTVTAGASASFSVAATGTTPLGYQWRRNGTPIGGATDSTYTRNNAQSADAGSYSVIVSNIVGTVTSSDAILTVNVAPSISQQPGNQNVNQGSSATFTVTASGTPAPAYQWRRNSTDVPGATLSTYTRANVQPADAGSYSVVTSNIVGTVTSSDAILTVNVAPTISQQPQNQNVNQTSNAVFTVVATGTPAPAYQWRRNTTPIAGATNSTYTRSNVQPADAGSYSVVVSNIAGTVTSAGAVLSVNVAPVITAQPQNLSVMAGSNATFTVTASGTPAPAYQWRRNTSDIPGATDSAYTRNNAQTTDAGSYSVVVSNVAGTATSDDAVLTVTLLTSPQIENITLTAGGQIQLQVNCAPGHWAVDATTNLVTADWVELTNFTTTGGTTQCFDSDTSQTHRFYRVRWIP